MDSTLICGQGLCSFFAKFFAIFQVECAEDCVTLKNNQKMAKKLANN